MEENIIKIEHLKKSFGSNSILADMNLKVKKGENLVVLGKSGTGKSVLIKCIVRLLEADEGSITVFDKDVMNLEEDELNEVRRKIGFLFQSAALYDSLTVRENLEFPLRVNRKMSKEDRNKLVEEALNNVGLIEAIDKMPSELSGGMKKRIGLARTLILKPEIMLYDEPTTGLDPITSREISRLILSVQKTYNTSSIIITHDIECAKITANRIIVVSNGEAMAEGTYEEMVRSENKEIRAYFE